jgi:excisionase family DNA binding protein
LALKREFLSTNEVAEMLGISPFTIRRYIQLRKLKALKLEGSYRVRRSDLKQFLKAREIETEEELVTLEEADDDKDDSARRAVVTKTARPSSTPTVKSKKTPARTKTQAKQSKPPRKNTTHKQKEP